MLREKLNKIFSYPFFLYLLPFFFVFHGFTENFFLVPVVPALLLLAKYCCATLVLHGVFFLIFRNNYKACLFSFILLCIFFFFGVFHDWLKAIVPGSFLAAYSFVLPFLLLLVLFAFLIIRKKTIAYKLAIYLNTVFVFFIFIDFFSLLQKTSGYDRQRQIKSISSEFIACDTCNKPDVHLIIADEYAGEKTIKDVFSSNNSLFYEGLKKRKFQVVENSFSNYNLTPLSIASILNLDYPELKSNDLSDIPMRPVYNLIDTNILVPFFIFHGYEFVNNSIFQVSGQPQFTIQPFTPVSTRLIESQTMLNRLMKDLGYLLVKWGISGKAHGDNAYTTRNNNNKIIENLKKQVLVNSSKPRFTYSHLMMPHFPYYFDSLGNAAPLSLILDDKVNYWRVDRYLSYLKYTNSVLLNLVDHILQHSAKPPVIILLSDHGFRLFSEEVDHKYHFYNLNATYLPAQYTINLPDSISNISYMRSLVNLLFRQQLSTNKQDKFFIPPITKPLDH